MKTQEITIWKRKVYNEKRDKKVWEHNHIEDGWVKNMEPKAKSLNQKKNWKDGNWSKQFGYLVNNKVVYI